MLAFFHTEMSPLPLGKMPPMSRTEMPPKVRQNDTWSTCYQSDRHSHQRGHGTCTDTCTGTCTGIQFGSCTHSRAGTLLRNSNIDAYTAAKTSSINPTFHYGSEQPRIETKVLDHSPVRSVVCSHCSLICLLRTACFTRALRYAHLFARLLTPEIMGKRMLSMTCTHRFHSVSTYI